jgi:Domain of unknown function (DUF1917)
MDETPGLEVRSSFAIKGDADVLPSSTNPCDAADGYYWVHAFGPARSSDDLNDLLIGKWLIRMTCPYVEEYWSLIAHAVEAGALGPSAKIATDWGREHDPAGAWRNHVVCVYTRDWRDEDDVLRVARRLHEIGAVKRMKLTYKPDVFTYDGRYEGNAPGDIAIYTCSAPYDRLTVNHENRATAEQMLSALSH